MAQTLVRKVLMQIDADDGDTEVKLDRITAKADELAEKHPELKVKIESAAALARLGVIRQELKDVGKPVTADVKVKDDAALSDALTKTKELTQALDQLEEKGGNGNGGQGLLSKILNGDGGEEGGGGGGSSIGDIPILGSLLTNPLLLLGVVAAIAAAASEVGALATGLTAAGLGIGSFAALAYPAFKQVTAGLGDTKAKLDKLPEPVQAAVGAVKGLEGGFTAMAKAFQPTVFKIMNEGLAVASQLLPYLGQFATAVAPALEGVIGMISSGMQSDQFGGLMSLLVELSGPVITAVGSGMKGLAKDIATLMERFSEKDVINSVNIAFRVLGAAISLLTGLIMEGQIAWDFLTQKALPDTRKGFDLVRHAVATAGHDIAKTFDGVRHGAATMAHDVAQDFDEARHAAATLAHDVAVHFDQARHDVAQWAGDVRTDIDNVVSWFEKLPGRIEQKVSNFGSLLVDSGKSLISGLITGIENSVPGLHTALSWVTSLIPSWKGPLSADQVLLLPAGRAIMAGLTDGLRNGLPNLKAMLTSVADAVKDKLITASAGSALTAWLKADNARLQTLATTRAKIAGEIANAKALASGTAQTTEGTYNLSSAATASGGTASASSIIGALRGDVTKIRKFAYDIRKLAKDGLNKSYLQQLIAMGPDSGGALAAELVAAGMGDIRQINAAETEITAASNQLGDASVSALDAGGKQSGSAFVKTLESQQADINAVMAAAARHMIAVLRKDLGIGGGAPAQKVEIRLVGGDKAFRAWLKKMIRVTGGDVQVVGS